MRRDLLVVLSLLCLHTGCPEAVPNVECAFELPAAGRVASTAGFNLLLNVRGAFTAEELALVRFVSDVEAAGGTGSYPDGVLLESGINTDEDCATGDCPAGARLTTPIAPGAHTITGSALTPRGTVACEATVVVEANAPPVLAAITITPTTPRTGDNLAFTFTATDTEDDAVSVAASWSGANGESFAGETLSSLNTTAGETWTLRLVPRDSFDVGAESTAQIVIGNTAPESPTLGIAPVPARDDGAIVCSVLDLGELDPDSAQTLTPTFSWEVDGADAGIASPSVGASDQAAGEEWTCSVVVSDGEETSAATTISTTVLAALSTPGSAGLTSFDRVAGFGLQRLGDSASLASPGDLDGDERSDLVLIDNRLVTVTGLGEPTGNAHAFVFSGADLDGAAAILGTGDHSTDIVGPDGLRFVAVSGAGDLNGDGVDDLVLGFRHVSLPSSNAGTGVFLVFGRDEGLPEVIDLETDGVAIYGGGELVGQAPCAVGDLDGDGFAELAITAPTAEGLAGRVYVIYGHGGAWISGFTPEDLLPGFRLEGSIAGQQLGTACAGRLDLDADGYDDLVVGAPGAGTSGNGRVLVYRGEEARWAGSLTSATADAIVDAAATGVGGFGIALSALGDHDGDGLDDFAVWAAGPDGGASGAGAVFIASGGDAALAGAITSDALPYSIDGQGALGFCKVMAGVDLDGNGLGDLACGDLAPNEASGLGGLIGARMFLGSATLSAERDWTDSDLVLTPVDDDDRPGASLAGVLDLDGDDYSELLVGAPDLGLVTSSGGQPTSAPGVVYLVRLGD